MLISKQLKIYLVSIASTIGLSIPAPAISQPKINCINPGSNVEYKESPDRINKDIDRTNQPNHKPHLTRIGGVSCSQALPRDRQGIDRTSQGLRKNDRDGLIWVGAISAHRATKSRLAPLGQLTRFDRSVGDDRCQPDSIAPNY